MKRNKFASDDIDPSKKLEPLEKGQRWKIKDVDANAKKTYKLPVWIEIIRLATPEEVKEVEASSLKTYWWVGAASSLMPNPVVLLTEYLIRTHYKLTGKREYPNEKK